MKLITFDDKESTKTSTKPRKNCIIDQDINDLKEAVNENANVLEYSQTETLIGVFNQQNLYRKIIKINKNDVVPTNNRYDLDISSLGAEQVFVDMTHSYFYELIDDDVDLHLHRPMTFTRYPNANTIGNLKKETLSVLDFDQTVVSFWIGENVNFDYIILVLEYTKGE